MDSDDVLENRKGSGSGSGNAETFGRFALSPEVEAGFMQAKDMLASLRRGELSHIGMRIPPSDEQIDAEVRTLIDNAVDA